MKARPRTPNLRRFPIAGMRVHTSRPRLSTTVLEAIITCLIAAAAGGVVVWIGSLIR